jgi:Signal transduction histidine kinase
MRFIPDAIYLDERGHRYRSMNLEQRAQLRKRYIANVPLWRHPSVGYFMALPLVGSVVLCTSYFVHAVGHLLFASSLYMLIVLLVALFWGVGPAFLAIILSSVALTHFFILPLNDLIGFDADAWSKLLQLIPFVISGLIIALITSQREHARLQALAAEQESQLYAESLEETNQRLEDANQTKDRFLSIASHELKTPITTIRGQAQLMLRRISKGSSGGLDGISTTLERINEQTGRLTMLIDELLDVSSIRTGKAHLNLRSSDIRALCREVVEDQRLLSDRTITLTLPDAPLVMHVDVDRFSQVLTNLVSNAIKYSPASRPIEVALRQDDEHVLICVRDYGRGISKDQQERIFETFYRTPDAQSSAKRGLGLGLAITKDIVERHNGRIWVDSEKGKGSVFRVELPLVVQESSITI